jgi:hypothetical protein
VVAQDGQRRLLRDGNAGLAQLRRLRAGAGLSREQVEDQTGVNEGTL